MNKMQKRIQMIQGIKSGQTLLYNGKLKTVKEVWFDYKDDYGKLFRSTSLTSWELLPHHLICVQFMENPKRVYKITRDTSLSLLSNKEETQSKSINTKKIAFEIIGIFEEKLNSLNLYLPDRMREGDGDEPTGDEASIFGETYYEFEDKIIDILKKNMED